MKIRVICDNEAKRVGLQPNWGFAALIESNTGKPILFDTGADGATLLHNSRSLGIDLGGIGTVVISHAHWDHTGGLSAVLRMNKSAELYLPGPQANSFADRKVTVVGKDSIRIREDVFSTGVLEGIEQSLVLDTEKGMFVVTGCAHPEMRSILDRASKLGRVCGIAGGFHGFQDFKLFEGLSFIYPCHCTQHKREILELFADKAFECAAGLLIEL